MSILILHIKKKEKMQTKKGSTAAVSISVYEASLSTKIKVHNKHFKEDLA
jgi:Ca2+/H+ antiporter